MSQFPQYPGGPQPGGPQPGGPQQGGPQQGQPQPVSGQANPWGIPAQQHGSIDPETGRPWPTDRCMVTVGFYVLSRCGAPAQSVCQRCGRGMCAAHTVAQPARSLCQACDAETGTTVPDPRDPTWAARYRRRYRTDASQRFRDDRLMWSFDRYDRHYVSPSYSTYDDWDDHDHDIYDS